MRRLIPLGMALVALLGGGAGSSAQTARVGVRDDAKMFSTEAVGQADRELADLRRDRGWDVIVQTIDSLNGEEIKDRAVTEAKSLKVHGLLVLIAKKEHKVWVAPSQSARDTFSHERTEAIAKAMSVDFKAGEFDRGLRGAVAEIRKDADSQAKAPAAKPRDVAPGPVLPVTRNPMAGPPIEKKTMLPMLLVGGLVALALIYFIGRSLGRAQANTLRQQGGYAPPPQGGYAPPPQGGYAPASPQGGYAPAQPPPGPRPAPPNAGQPGYGPPPGPGYPAGGYGPGYPPPGYGAPPPPPRQGGGFVSGALGGLGGAVIGNILYDQFGRPHTPEGHPGVPQGTFPGGGAVPPVHTGGSVGSPPPPGETYDPNAGAGADWGSSPDPAAQPNPDWSSNDTGAQGDWGSAPASPPAAEEWNQAGVTGGDWGGQESAPDNSAGAGGDWGTPEPAPDDSAGAGGDWGGDAGSGGDTGGDQGDGGSW